MMREDQHSVTDADLMAYANGQLDEQRRRAVEDHLSRDPELAAEAAEWLRQNEAIRTLFGGVADEPVPSRLDPHRIAAAAIRTRNRWLAATAAACVLFAAGIGTGWYANTSLMRPTDPGAALAVAALSAHHVFAAENRHAVEVAASDQDHLVSWLSNRLGEPLVAPDLTAHGYALIGGRLLPFNDTKAAQLMYENPSGDRLTLFIVAGGGTMPEVDYASAGNLHAYYWVSDAISCAMVGTLSGDALKSVASSAWRQLVAAL